MSSSIAAPDENHSPGVLRWGSMRIRRLSDTGNRLGLAAPHLTPNAAQQDRSRKQRRPDRARYGTAQWQRVRWHVLVRDDFTCRMCGWEHELAQSCRALKAIDRPDLIKGRAPELVADHIIPHRGDEAKFWDEGNLQCLCKTCHDRDKQRAERAAEG